MDDSNTEQTSLPSAGSVNDVTIAGYLNKHFPKSWWRFCSAWKRKYCSLNGNKLYFNDSPSNSGHEKTSGIINLEHFDVCEQLSGKDTKNCGNTFVIYSTVHCNAGLFDLKHTFAAASKDEMNKWIESVRHAIKEAKLARKTDSTRRKSDKSESSAVNEEEKRIEVNLGGLTVDETLMNATKSRPKGPKGRRPPLRKSMQPQCSARMNGNQRKVRANSLGFVSENIDEESDENSAHSDTRKSRSLHSVEDQDSIENTCDEEDYTKQSSDSNDFTMHNYHKEVTPRSQLNNKNKQISPLIQELQQRYGTQQIHPKIVRRSESDRSSFGMDTNRNSDSHGAVNKNVKDMSSFLGELKSSITEIEIEMYSLKREMNKFREKIGEQNSDEFEMKVKEKLQAVDRMYSEAYIAMQEARKAEETYKMLSNECRIVLKQLKSFTDSANRSRSTPDFIDQIDNDSIGYI